MQTVLEQGSIDKPLTFDVGLIQLSFIPVCSLNNTCNISVKLCRGFTLQCFSFLQALNVVASEVMVGDTCIPSLIVINTTINQLETNNTYCLRLFVVVYRVEML